MRNRYQGAHVYRGEAIGCSLAGLCSNDMSRCASGCGVSCGPRDSTQRTPGSGGYYRRVCYPAGLPGFLLSFRLGSCIWKIDRRLILHLWSDHPFVPGRRPGCCRCERGRQERQWDGGKAVETVVLTSVSAFWSRRTRRACPGPYSSAPAKRFAPWPFVP